MTYEKFLAIVTKRVQEEMGEEYRVWLHHVLKNNATSMDGISILKIGEKISPTIYLNEFYQELSDGRTISEIVHEVRKIYEMHDTKMEFQIDEFKDYKKVKEKLAVKLINYEKNCAMLEEVPYQKFLDLAVVCYVLIGKVESNTASILVRQEHRKIWKVSEKDLFLQAIQNTSRILPPELKSMDTFIREALPNQKEGFEGEIPMYVLTNTMRFYGAAALLYQNVVSDFAEQIGMDLYILPSSIHEVILVPQVPEIEKEVLEQMVQEVNQEEVEQEEQLSDHVYSYQCVEGEFYL